MSTFDYDFYYDEAVIIPNSEKAKLKYGYRNGVCEYKITRQQLEQLAEGKCLALNIADEYTGFLTVERS
jgi:hypothetical protein